MTLFVDTSALAKLITREDETDALRRFLRDASVVASALVRTELLRVGLRLGDRHLERAEAVLAGVSTVTVTRARLDRAGRLLPSTLRSLDAVHLATAVELSDSIEAFVAYDDSLLGAAREHGLVTASPR